MPSKKSSKPNGAKSAPTPSRVRSVKAKPPRAEKSTALHYHTLHADAAGPRETRDAKVLRASAASLGADAGQALFSATGKMSTFGGPKDNGVRPDEDLALFTSTDATDPRFSNLFLPVQPPGTTGAARRLNPDALYLACRWDYSTTPRSLLRNTTATVTNSATGASLQASPADWGPSPGTGRVADLSPGLARQLGLETDDHVTVALYGAGEQAAPGAAAGTAAGAPRIYTTAEWGAMPALVSSFAQHPALGIVIHNTQGSNRPPFADADEEQQAAFDDARAIQRSHMVTDHQWSDTGQHFTISRGGVITEGRHGSLDAAYAGNVVQGAHAGETIHNEKWFGIEVAGDNRASYQVTDVQFATLVELCAWLSKWRDTGALPIIGHLDVLHATDCPGKLEDHLGDLHAQVGARLAQLA